MCMVSAIMDYSKNRVQFDTWIHNPTALIDLKKIIKLLEGIDKKLGQPDCVDPEKEKFIEEIEQAIKKYQETQEYNRQLTWGGLGIAGLSNNGPGVTLD